MGVSIQITRTDANLVLINVKIILPALLSFDLHPKVIGLRVYLSAYEKIKIIVKTKRTETDSGVCISTKEGYYVHIINLSSHGIRVYVRYVCPYCPDIIRTRLN